MNRRRLAILLLTTAWTIGLAIVVKSAIDRLTVSPWGNPLGDSTLAQVTESTEVGQAFRAPLPGLYRIEVELVPTEGGKAYPLTFHLKADPAATTDLYTQNFDVTEIEEGIPVGFEFEPIRESQDRTFFFYLESPESRVEGAPWVRFGPDAEVEGSSAYLNGQPVAGNLEFYSFYTLRTRDKVNVFLARLAEGRPYVLGTKGFYAILAGAYLLVLALFLVHVGKIISNGQDKEL